VAASGEPAATIASRIPGSSAAYFHPADPTNDDNIIAHNDLSNPWANIGGASGKGNRTIMECNRIHDSADGTSFNYPRNGLDILGTNGIYRFNDIYNAGDSGIAIESYTYGYTQVATGNHIYHNTVWNTRYDSLRILVRDDGQIANNVVENNVFWQAQGFPYESRSYAVMFSFYHAVESVVWSPGTANGNVVRNNIFPNGQDGVLFVRRRNPDGSDANLVYTLNQLPGWTSNRQVNPLLRDPLQRDFTLLSSSPAIDAGRVIGGVSFLGSGPDQGAHERPPDSPVRTR
jgi:hypothetical protein